MLHLLIDSGNAPPTGGIGVYSSGLMEALRKYCPDSINVQELGASWTGKSLRPLRRLVYLSRVNRFRRTSFNGADVVHFTNFYVPQRCSSVSYTATIYDIDPVAMPEAHSKRYGIYFRNVLKNTIERADTLIVNSNTVRLDLVNLFGVAEKKIAVLGIGISEAFKKLADTQEKITTDVPTLFFVGALGKKKNIAWLIRTVVAGVRSGALPQLRLILAGSRGFGFNEIQSELALAGDIVQYIPSPTLPEIVKLYCSCSAFIFPSLREGFGIPLLEAMYCGKPIVASRIPSSTEVAKDIAHFFTLKNADELYHAVHTAIANKNSVERKSSVVQRLQTYSWEYIAPAYIDIYNSTISSNR